MPDSSNAKVPTKSNKSYKETRKKAHLKEQIKSPETNPNETNRNLLITKKNKNCYKDTQCTKREHRHLTEIRKLCNEQNEKINKGRKR